MIKLKLELSLTLLLTLFIHSCATTPDEIKESQVKDAKELAKLTGIKDSNLETLVVMGLNDIHGALAPEKVKTKDPEPVEYTKGAASILSSHVKILRNEFKDRLLILDAGDQFQGSIDSNLTNGKSMITFYNHIGLNAAAIGNHEFDFGPLKEKAQSSIYENSLKANDTSNPQAQKAIDLNQHLRGTLYQRISEAKYPYLAANIYSRKSGLAGIPNTQPSTIIQRGRLKVGIIGLSTLDTPTTTRAEFVKDLEFKEMSKITIAESKKLRASGADIVLILTHSGLFCDVAEKSGKFFKTSQIKKESDLQSDCRPNDEITKLAKSLTPGVVDGIVSGHSHSLVHHWINGIPIIQGGTRNQYYNLIYLTYDFAQKKLRTDLTLIEGPVPICEKVFQNQKNCNGDIPAPVKGRGNLVTPVFHGKTVEADPEMDAVLAPTFAATKAFKDKKIAESKIKLEHKRHEESPLGSLVADSLRASIKADIAIMNSGGVRAPIESGSITYENIFRALPFDNYVSEVTLNGKELKLLLRIVESGSRGYFPTSGLELKILDPKYEPSSNDLNQNGSIEPWEINRFISASIVKCEGQDYTHCKNRTTTPIEDDQIYKVATIDFLVSGGDDGAWFFNQIDKNKINLQAGPFARDAFVNYLSTLPYSLGSSELEPQLPRLVFQAAPKKEKKPTKRSNVRSSLRKKRK